MKDYSYDDTSFWQPRLLPEEFILWQGRPHGAMKLDKTALYLALPATVGGLIILFQLYFGEALLGGFALSSPQMDSQILWGVLAVAIYLVGYVLWHSDFTTSRNTRYVVTNKRALIATGRFFPRITAKHLTPMTPLVWDGQVPGSIYFDDRLASYGSNPQSAPFSPSVIKTKKVGFQNIEQSSSVHSLMQRVTEGRR